MKKITSNNLIKKLIISIVCIILLNFCFTPTCKAANFGGKMMGYITDFATGITDVVATLIQFGLTGDWIWAVDSPGSGKPDGDYWVNTANFRYPILQISPELIFANQVQLLDVNFVSDIKDSSEYILGMKDSSILKTLRDVIAGWYVTLRTIAAVGLLSVLIYMGIRIIISSTSGEKAKYKERLVDWIVAFCLLLFMHYIMAATITIVNKVNDMLGATIDLEQGLELNEDYGTVEYLGGTAIGGGAEGTTGVSDKYEGIRPEEVIEKVKEKAEKDNATLISESDKWETVGTPSSNGSNKRIERVKYEIEYEEYTATIMQTRNITESPTTGMQSIKYSYLVKYVKPGDEGGEIADATTGRELKISSDPNKVMYFTNYARLYLNAKDNEQYTPMATAYLILYIALVSFTAVFAFRYMKRVLYIAFLTLIAPLVALTYPIDKLRDRKSTRMEWMVERVWD